MRDELYHELMSEICLTRAMLFLGMATTTYELCEHPLSKIILSAANTVIAVLYLICFYVEKRSAGE